MEEARNLYFRRKARVIFDRRFPVINGLSLGDKGQILFKGEVKSCRIIEEGDVDNPAADVIITEVEILKGNTGKRI